MAAGFKEKNRLKKTMRSKIMLKNAESVLKAIQRKAAEPEVQM